MAKHEGTCADCGRDFHPGDPIETATPPNVVPPRYRHAPGTCPPRAPVVDTPTMPDKRDECGCHKGCTMLPHDCHKPCRWPECLTEAEQRQLAEDVLRDL